jgi:hypothetical protein
MKPPEWVENAPERKRETSWGSLKFQFCVPGSGLLSPVLEISIEAESGR